VASAFSQTVTGLPVLEPKKLRRWLDILFASYRTPLVPDAMIGYTIGLADLTARELELAFSEALRRHRSKFPPAPGEVRGYMEAALERMPQRPSAANEACKDCGGTGFRLVERAGARFAVDCKCVRKELVK
jgi:hypothetical protein